MNSVQSIFNYFLEQKNKSPNKTAICYSNIAITYQELFDKVIYYSDLTRSLCSNRVPVALHMDRTPDLIAAMFACCYLDRPYIPFDTNHPLERKLSILNNLGLNVLEIPDILPLSKNVAFPNTAYILFTSGSTGQPKGIEINVRGVTNLIKWAGDYYTPEQLQCVLASTTICFDLSTFEIFVPLCLGYSIYLVDNILDLLNKKPQYSKITLINSVPSAMREIVEAGCIPSNVNTINLAGEALYWSLVDKLYLKSSIKSVYNLWGPSEDTTFSSIYKCSKYHDGKQPSVPIGKSIKGSKIKLVDSEIWLSGPCLANGYYKREDLNKTKFVIKNSIRYFRTGDIAELDKDGNLVFKGRIDFQVKIRGFRIELEELENHVLNMEHTIDVGVTTIDEGQNIKLVIVLLLNNSGSIEDIKKQLSKRVTGYMMPHYWLTVDNPLPRTPNGKLCRQTLKKLVSQNYLLPNKQFNVDSFCSLVSTVLNVPVDPNLSLISQGGDSLDAVRIFSECNKRWNNNITLEKLLSQNYTIADLEKLADVTRVKTLEESLTLFKDNEVSFEEARMYNVYIHSKDSSSYNIAIKFNILGKKLDIDKLRKSCHYILSNNKILQCNYVLKNGEIYKQYNPKDVIISDILDPSFQDLPFDLSTDLLVRVILTRQISDCYCLYFCFPHVVIDGIGVDNLMNQISKYYAGNDVNVDHVIISNSRNCISQALEFWEKELAQYEPLVSWPNNNYLSSNSYRNAIEIDTETKKILCDYAYKLDLSLPTLLFGAFYITLYRMDFGKFLTIGCLTANRCSPARQQLVANCINTLPILAEIRGDDTVKQFFSYFRKKFLQCLSFQNVPIDKVLFAIANKGQHKNFDNIFDIIFSYLDIGKTFEIEGLSIESEIMFPKTSKAPLVLSVVDKNDKLEFIFECQGCRISQKYLKVLGEIFKHLLLELPISETKKIDSINMLPKRHLQTIRSNAVYNKIDCKEDLVQSFLKITGTYPKKIAIIDQDHSITYEELLIEAKKVKNAILRKNILPESAIGVSMPKTWRVVSSILGILLSGCYYVPLDPRNPPSRNQYIRSKSGITLVITKDLYQEFSDIDVSDKDFHQNREFLDKIAYVIFTSGTTGNPKGVAITHRNVARLFLACQEWAHFSDKDTWTLFHSYAFDFSVWEIFGAILYGGTLVVVRDEICKDFKKFLKLITDNKISILS
jgi:non-ribosomal peptide synthetase component F/acyl carrier protein